MSKPSKKSKSPAVKTSAPQAAPPVITAPAKPAAEPGNKPVAAAKGAPSGATSPRPNRVLIELVKPEAQSVFVAGSFNDWKPESTPLKAAGNGRWVGDLVVKPGRHEYLFVVDGQWLPDPNANEAVQNPFGGKNSVLIVSE